ncbi:hypothetical protein [Stutzerimonas nitrititolerans]|uniref:hypothetical protein n=1 Tax=Stutzerimonas nitrititolerans TaxID=2482751 RepID=UPI00289A0822|nr:hypothetical protein [Stutzerimonas nitrititolerans]
MLWKAALYGSADVSKSRVIITNVALVVTLISIYGWWTDFVPSAAWVVTGFSIAMTATIICVAAFYWAVLTGRTTFRPNTSVPMKILVVLFGPIIVFLIFSLSIMHGVGDITTRVIGRDEQLISDLSKHYNRSSRRSCDFRLEGHGIDTAFPNHVCITEAAFTRLPQKGVYRLHILRTELGFHIVSFDLAPSR